MTRKPKTRSRKPITVFGQTHYVTQTAKGLRMRKWTKKKAASFLEQDQLPVVNYTETYRPL